MFGFIGVGQAGGNIANSMSKLGFKSVAINYSQTDLDSIGEVSGKLKLIGTEGVGKRRDRAMSMMSKNMDSMQNFIEKHFASTLTDVIVVVFSTGGGTGSGISPLIIEVISHHLNNKIVVACPILPSSEESPISQYNTIKLSEELSRLDVCVLPIDNDSLSKYAPSGSRFSAINDKFAQLFNTLYNYTNKASSSGVLDKRDLAEILSVKGVGLIAETDIASLDGEGLDISVKGMSEAIRKSWESSIFVKPSYDTLESMGLIYDGQKSMLPDLSQRDISAHFKYEPRYVYEGIYNSHKGKVITVLTGMRWFNARLKSIESKLNSAKESPSVKDTYTSSVNMVLDGSNKPTPKKSPLDILSKYQNR